MSPDIEVQTATTRRRAGQFLRDIRAIRRHKDSSPPRMASRASRLAAVPRTYAELRSSVEQTLLTGQRLIERAKVRTYWETGRLIKEHLLLNEDRAANGAQVIPRLARDLDVSDRVLYQCVQFARVYAILHPRAEFTWGHYRLLIQVPDPAQRKAIEAEAARRDWTSHQLEARVREISLLNAPPEDRGNGQSASSASAPKLLVPQCGTPGLFRVVRGTGRRSRFQDLPAAGQR